MCVPLPPLPYSVDPQTEEIFHARLKHSNRIVKSPDMSTLDTFTDHMVG